MSMKSPPLAADDVSSLRFEMMQIAVRSMLRCLPSCAAGTHHQRNDIIAEGSIICPTGKHHSKTRDLVDKSRVFDVYHRPKGHYLR